MDGTKFGYSEKVKWLVSVKQQFEGQQPSGDIQRQIDITEREVFEFEQKVFEIIFSSIESELGEIEKLNNIAQNNNNEDLQAYINSETNRRMQNITVYGNQIYSLYNREMLISIYEDRKKTCQTNIDYNKKKLEENAEDKVSIISLRNEERDLAKAERAISFLNGTAREMMYSSLPKSEIGNKIL